MRAKIVRASMKKLNLINLSRLNPNHEGDYFPSFTVDGYEFHSQADSIRPRASRVRDGRVHKQNAYAQFSHKQLGN